MSKTVNDVLIYRKLNTEEKMTFLKSQDLSKISLYFMFIREENHDLANIIISKVTASDALLGMYLKTSSVEFKKVLLEKIKSPTALQDAYERETDEFFKKLIKERLEYVCKNIVLKSSKRSNQIKALNKITSAEVLLELYNNPKCEHKRRISKRLIHERGLCVFKYHPIVYFPKNE